MNDQLLMRQKEIIQELLDKILRNFFYNSCDIDKKYLKGICQRVLKKFRLMQIFTVNFLINSYNLYQHMQADIQDAILKKLVNSEVLDSAQLQVQYGLNHQAMYAELVSLVALNYITLQNRKVVKFVLTAEGQSYAQRGTPEARIYQLSNVEGTPKETVQGELKDEFKIGFGNAMKKKIVVLKDGKIFRTKQGYQDDDKNKLLLVRENKGDQLSKEDVKALKSRKLIEQKTQTFFLIRKGQDYREEKVELVPELTSAMLANGSWEKCAFKKFNPTAKGLDIENGNLHLLMKTRTQLIEILIQMGFEEMKTDRYVESSFWNFDTLFQPQAHPARDAHDTFFVSHPEAAKVEDKQYFQAVKNIHEKGGFGSKGYDYEWDPKEAYKNILRTHTTAVSSRYLKMISQEKPFRPRKFFSIDRVFRNQTLDNTHLAQFHQVQGFVIDRNLGLQHLIGILTQFYKKIGIEKIWLKPTYNPYTEPSMEVYGYHPILKKKVEMGNSGIFRPEMLRPMGFPEDVSVIAWGLGLERPTMIQFGMANIKELFGPGVILKKVKDSAIYCL